VVFQFIGYSSQHFPSTDKKMTIALLLAGRSGTAQRTPAGGLRFII
jgi:hypothetical protein